MTGSAVSSDSCVQGAERMSSMQADSERSWAVDFVMRKQQAADVTASFKKQAMAKHQGVSRVRDF